MTQFKADTTATLGITAPFQLHVKKSMKLVNICS